MDVYPNIEFTYIKVYLSGNCWYKKKLLYTRDKSLCKEQMRNFFTIYLFFSFWILSFSRFKQLQWLNQENTEFYNTYYHVSVCLQKNTWLGLWEAFFHSVHQCTWSIKYCSQFGNGLRYWCIKNSKESSLKRYIYRVSCCKM